MGGRAVSHNLLRNGQNDQIRRVTRWLYRERGREGEDGSSGGQSWGRPEYNGIKTLSLVKQRSIEKRPGLLGGPLTVGERSGRDSKRGR